jgi:hypothetical protein
VAILKAAPVRTRRALVVALASAGFGAVFASAALPAAAMTNPELERSVKAAFLVKFLAYTEFPARAFSDGNAPMVLAVLGADDMASELQRIVAGRTVNGRPMQVRSLRDGEPVQAVHLLFVAGSDNARLARVLRQPPPGPILVVSECSNGLQTGSSINFRVIEQHVRFDVSLDAAEKNNIRLSSRLLSVANHVSKGVP